MEKTNNKFQNTDFYKWVSQRNIRPITDMAEVRRLYDSFAENYEEFYTGDEGCGYAAHENASKILHTHLQRIGYQTDSKILDFGAGTGLVGVCLSKYGYNNLDALDLSEKMLEEAKKKNVYQEFFKFDALKDDLSCIKSQHSQNPSLYEAVISIACFAPSKFLFFNHNFCFDRNDGTRC